MNQGKTVRFAIANSVSKTGKIIYNNMDFPRIEFPEILAALLCPGPKTDVSLL